MVDINDLKGKTFSWGSNGNGNGNTKPKSKNVDDSNDKTRCQIAAFKYSGRGKYPLREAIILENKPCFISNNKTKNYFIIEESIVEETRIINPPVLEEYPYTPYEFKDKAELDLFYERASKISSIAELYRICKERFFQRYIDQDKKIIVLLSADAILSYFQDLFPVIHYAEGIGGNDVGKSSIGYTFAYTGYRVVKGVSISGANYPRILGSIEPGQCVIIEDEGDSISEDPDKVRILKAGYEYDAMIPKTNINTTSQELKWFFPYCYKIILAERSLSHYKARGLVDRTFTFKCMPGKVKQSVKSVVSNTVNKSAKLIELYNEFLDFRKLMLCYRLIHYTYELPEIETNLTNRNLELAGPILQLFYGCECFDEIVEALEVFINQRMERKSSSIEAILYKIVKTFADEFNTKSKFVTIQYSQVWSKIINGEIDGTYNDKKVQEYETTSYGTIYRDTLSRTIADQFGAELDRNKKGSVLKIDVEKFRKVGEVYDNVDAKGAQEFKINVWLKRSSDSDDNQKEYGNDTGVTGVTSVGSSDGKGIENEQINNSKDENQSQIYIENSIEINEKKTFPRPEVTPPTSPTPKNKSQSEYNEEYATENIATDSHDKDILYDLMNSPPPEKPPAFRDNKITSK